jgi:hypothetical protein
VDGNAQILTILTAIFTHEEYWKISVKKTCISNPNGGDVGLV